MKNAKTFARLLAVAAIATLGTVAWNASRPAQADATVGKAAPNFSLKDSNGRTRKLSDFRGRIVVLEWLNHDCPFVKKHYNSGNMQRVQRQARANGAVWLSINSSASGKQGHVNGAQANSLTKSKNAAPSAVLLDASGKVGRAYNAKTTPHMYLISERGTVLYNGAIDDKPSVDEADVKGAKNFVLAALAQAKRGERISVPVTQPYGCSVKY